MDRRGRGIFWVALASFSAGFALRRFRFPLDRNIPKLYLRGMETWRVIESKLTWDKATRTWSHSETVVKTGVSRPEADSIMLHPRNAQRRHNLHARPETETERNAR